MEIYRFAFLMVGDVGKACDLTQRTFYRLQEEYHDGAYPQKIRKRLFETLYGMILRTPENNLMSSEERPDEGEIEADSPLSRSDKGQGPRSVVSTLQKLERDYRGTMVLFYTGEFSYRDIGEILNISVELVMSKIWRGKLALKSSLKSKQA